MFYYNIKIKSDNGEYCLESTDRDIIQREMDIYFSHFYNVSEEFKGKIKKAPKINSQQTAISEQYTVNEPKTTALSSDKTNSLQLKETKSQISQVAKIHEPQENPVKIQKTNDEFVQLANPEPLNYNQGYKVSDIEHISDSPKQPITLNRDTVFKPVAKEELVFNNIKSPSETAEFEVPKQAIKTNEVPFENSIQNNAIGLKTTEIQDIVIQGTSIKDNTTTVIDDTIHNQYVEPIELVSDVDSIESSKHDDNVIQIEDVIQGTITNTNNKEIKNESQNENNIEYNLDEIEDSNENNNEQLSANTIKETIKFDNKELPEIVSIKQQQDTIQSSVTDTISQSEAAKTSSSSDFEIIGLDVDEKKLREERLKEEKQNKLNKTLELVESAIKNVDISSDATFNIDIPDTYSKRLTPEEIEKAIDKEFDEDDFGDNANVNTQTDTASQNQQVQEIQPSTDLNNSILPNNDMQPVELQTDAFDETENSESSAPEISSIFSDESPFENPPESQNIIAAKEYPETKQALNLDFKTFLSNYNSNGIIDEFLICAYYIKHICGQHSFNMKYINSKLFQATGNIADSSIINGLIEGQFIKVIEVDGVKKYTISSVGEEYFMNHYQG